MRALRAAAHDRYGRRVLVLAPTGKAVDVAMREGAGDAGMTIAKALKDSARKPAAAAAAHPRHRG